jgi:hypothetical protein
MKQEGYDILLGSTVQEYRGLAASFAMMNECGDECLLANAEDIFYHYFERSRMVRFK